MRLTSRLSLYIGREETCKPRGFSPNTPKPEWMVNGGLYIDMRQEGSDIVAGRWLLRHDELHQSSIMSIGSGRDYDAGPGEYRIVADGRFDGAAACASVVIAREE